MLAMDLGGAVQQLRQRQAEQGEQFLAAPVVADFRRHGGCFLTAAAIEGGQSGNPPRTCQPNNASRGLRKPTPPLLARLAARPARADLRRPPAAALPAVRRARG